LKKKFDFDSMMTTMSLFSLLFSFIL